ncbi:RNA polymerase sigma factor [Bhargavaea beijingensis]|uniref:RNA polymerase sigma factor n=1 Tax=Bhargavaea beijingensis TaxID=426756 RepID=UPI002224AF53|nr:sigma-70 family RNA polymerase sigma factor [Bhargavaea beijingensis]MCW1927921.1 sigma-70 family RNA polymerase sigma factor [Bhargavaea beijingensis]
MEEGLGVFLSTKLEKVYKTLRKMGANKEDAEDIIQETAYRFILYIDGIDINYSEAWLHRVAINQFYDLMKKRKTIRGYLENIKIEDLLDYHTPEQVVLDIESRQKINKWFDNISRKNKEMILLKYVAGLSLKEIAMIYKTTDKSVKTQLARSRTKLKRLIRWEEKV